ncbi:MAG: hypothetical protein ACK5P7_02495 [Bdellovibrio sp.]
MSGVKSYFQFKNDSSGEIIAVKSAIFKGDPMIQLPGVSWSRMSGPPLTTVVASPDSWIVGLVDFVFAMNVHAQLMRAKIDTIFDEPIWSEIASDSDDPPKTVEFLASERRAIFNKVDDFLVNLNIWASRVRNHEELLQLRRNISSHIALGGLAKMVEDADDDV